MSPQANSMDYLVGDPKPLRDSGDGLQDRADSLRLLAAEILATLVANRERGALTTTPPKCGEAFDGMIVQWRARLKTLTNSAPRSSSPCGVEEGA